MTDLFHYTCDHSHLRIGGKGTLFPGRMLVTADTAWPARAWQSALVWATDLTVPMREGLGLTSVHIRCDRTQHRYRLTLPGVMTPWPEYRKTLLRNGVVTADDLDVLEGNGARPMHWWVSTQPQPAVYDPVKVGAS